MSLDLVTVLPNEGLGDLKFGMTRKEVKALIGEPDEIENSPFYEDEESVEMWHYDKHDFSIVFENDPKSTLEYIATSSPDTILCGEKLINKTYDEVLKFLEKTDCGKYEKEEFEEGGDMVTLLYFNENQVNLWFDDGILTEIQWNIII